MSLNHVSANAARFKKQRAAMFPKQFSTATAKQLAQHADLDAGAEPSSTPCVISIECSVAFVDTFRHLIPAACDIIDCSPIDDDIKIWRFKVRVPHWPYQGRQAIAVVHEDLLSRSVELLPGGRGPVVVQ